MSSTKRKHTGASQSKISIAEETGDLLKSTYGSRIPPAFVSGLSKKYGRRVVSLDSKAVKKLIDPKYKSISSEQLMEYLSNKDLHRKGKPLSENSVKRVFENASNADGTITFDRLMTQGQESNINISAALAKTIVRRYGKAQGFLTL